MAALTANIQRLSSAEAPQTTNLNATALPQASTALPTPTQDWPGHSWGKGQWAGAPASSGTAPWAHHTDPSGMGWSGTAYPGWQWQSSGWGAVVGWQLTAPHILESRVSRTGLVRLAIPTPRQGEFGPAMARGKPPAGHAGVAATGRAHTGSWGTSGHDALGSSNGSTPQHAPPRAGTKAALRRCCRKRPTLRCESPGNAHPVRRPPPPGRANSTPRRATHS